MEDTRLEELLEDEHQKLLFVFDYMTERAFFMELREIIPGKDRDKAVFSKSIGEAPVQIMSFDEDVYKRQMVHCSGGAQTKVMHFIGNNCRVVKDNMLSLIHISPPRQPDHLP